MNTEADFRARLAELAVEAIGTITGSMQEITAAWSEWEFVRMGFTDWLEEQGRGTEAAFTRTIQPRASRVRQEKGERIIVSDCPRVDGSLFSSAWWLPVPPGITLQQAYEGKVLRKLWHAVNARPLLHFAPQSLEYISLSWPYGGVKFPPHYNFLHHVTRDHLDVERKPTLDRKILVDGFCSLAVGSAFEQRIVKPTPLLDRMEGSQCR